MAIATDENYSLVPIVYDAVHTPPLRGIDVLAAGDVALTDSTGVTAVYPVPAAALPYRLTLRIKSINTTDSTVAAASIKGLIS